jgi:hypothetical protein
VVRFVETRQFTKRQPRFLPGEMYCALQKELIAEPGKGHVMPACGGLRKLRISDPPRQKGKRGGARVICLHIPDADHFLMLGIYSKNEKEDLTSADKKEFRMLAQAYKRQVSDAIARREPRQ